MRSRSLSGNEAVDDEAMVDGNNSGSEAPTAPPQSDFPPIDGRSFKDIMRARWEQIFRRRDPHDTDDAPRSSPRGSKGKGKGALKGKPKGKRKGKGKGKDKSRPEFGTVAYDLWYERYRRIPRPKSKPIRLSDSSSRRMPVTGPFDRVSRLLRDAIDRAERDGFATWVVDFGPVRK